MRKEWEGFVPGRWTEQIDVEEFINLNYHPYDGDDSFLAGPTERTKECYARVQELLVEERNNRYQLNKKRAEIFLDSRSFH